MWANLATPVRTHFGWTYFGWTAALFRLTPVCLTIALGLASVASGAASVDDPDAAVGEVAAPAARAFDPAKMPEVGVTKSPLGYHYAELSPTQTSALRRGFKLPLDALASARTIGDLDKAVVLAPLPNPNRPLLAVSPADESLANPFADTASVSFRSDPLKALGELLGKLDPASAGSAAAAPSATSGADDPFGVTEAAPAAAPTAEVESEEDPFSAEAPTEAPAAEEGDDDPFSDF